ncbi:phage tail protein [Lysobacter sp. K5869]|uniref:phage tail protein n=1 Tax=Lysobacter sp. K5869 TaxID=2820808 RepID=UPI001C060D6B|nr:tail fiber protein [Lysobacter sp. K5869]QWP75687.1 phage tail protein [Lysobacter sp. K5869]
MTEPYIGEIQIFGFNFAPRGWAPCTGALMPIQQNTALFALLGTTYGGDGKTTYQLPNLVNRAACRQGQGPGLSNYTLGETVGSDSVTLTSNEMPTHNHFIQTYNQNDVGKRSGTPSTNNCLGSPTSFAFAGVPANAPFAPTMLQPTGGGGPHENRQPYLATNFCIALQGVFPAFP